MNFIMLCHAPGEKSIADYLRQHLLDDGFNVWQPNDDNLIQQKAAAACSAFVLLMSPEAQADASVAALLAAAETAGRVILPVLVKGEVFPQFASSPKVDLSAGTANAGLLSLRVSKVISKKPAKGMWVTPNEAEFDTEDEAAGGDAHLTSLAKPKSLEFLRQAMKDSMQTRPKPPKDGS